MGFYLLQLHAPRSPGAPAPLWPGSASPASQLADGRAARWTLPAWRCRRAASQSPARGHAHS
eukprot:4797693-Prymnesium_polylepis.1